MFHRKRENLTGDGIASLGVLRKGLGKDDVKGMKPEVLENLKDYSDDLDVEAAKQLFKSLYEGGGSRRKRATTGRKSFENCLWRCKLSNMTDRGGNGTYDLENSRPMLCQLRFEYVIFRSLVRLASM